MKSMILLWATTIILLNSSCTDSKTKNVIADNYPLHVPRDSATLYFPVDSTSEMNREDAMIPFVNEWYSRHLFHLEEPVLSTYKGDKEVFRFTWLRTFHHPVTIRLQKEKDSIILFAKINDGRGGYDPGQLILATSVPVTKKQYDTLMGKLKQVNFHSLTTHKRDDGKDGSEWIYESVRNNQYHVVTRWSPTEKQYDDYRGIGEYLLSIAKIDKAEMENFY
jgi:hypothetical protein